MLAFCIITIHPTASQHKLSALSPNAGDFLCIFPNFLLNQVNQPKLLHSSGSNAASSVSPFPFPAALSFPKQSGHTLPRSLFFGSCLYLASVYYVTQIKPRTPHGPFSTQGHVQKNKIQQFKLITTILSLSSISLANVKERVNYRGTTNITENEIEQNKVSLV